MMKMMMIRDDNDDNNNVVDDNDVKTTTTSSTIEYNNVSSYEEHINRTCYKPSTGSYALFCPNCNTKAYNRDEDSRSF